MKGKNAFLPIIALILILGGAFAAPTITVVSPNGAAYLNGTITVTVSLVDTNADAQIDLNLGASAASGGNYSNVLSAYRLTNATNCTSYSGNATTQFNCAVSLNTALFDDGNYYINAKAFNIYDGLDSSSGQSDNSVQFDNTGPSTTVDGYGADWNALDQLLHFKCVDALNTCASIKVGWDGNASQTYNASEIWVPISKDGNTQVTYYSTDSLGNNEVQKKIYTLIDKTAPAISNRNPGSGDYNKSTRPLISFNVTDNGSRVKTATSDVNVVIDGNPILYASLTIVPITDGNTISYLLPYDANNRSVSVHADVNDHLGNKMTSDWSFTIDTIPPTISSITISDTNNYTNSATPTVTLNSPAGDPAQMALSCNGTAWKAWQAYNASASDFNLATTSYGCQSNVTVTIYLKLRDAAGNESAAVSDSTYYDTVIPGTPGSFSAGAESDGDIALIWSASTDSTGTVAYYLYRGTVSGFTPGTEIASTTAVTYTDSNTNLTRGTRYYYKVKARDYAGNYSAESAQADANSWTAVAAPADTTAPELFWENPSNNGTVSGVVTLTAQAYDDESGISQVKFYLDNATSAISTVYTAVSQRYYFDWNSATVVDGTHTLKVIAISRNANTNYSSAVRTITVTANNGVSSIGTPGGSGNADEDAAVEAINAAGREKASARALLAELRGIGSEPSALAQQTFDDATGLLSDANRLLDGEDFNAAKVKAAGAKQLFLDLKGIVSIDPLPYKAAQVYGYVSEKLALFLQGVGLQKQLADKAVETAGKLEIKRSIAIRKVSDSNTFYKAVVTIYLKNNSDTLQQLHVAEVVPKGFADSADKIASGKEFTVVKADPILLWGVSLEAGASTEINYALKASLSRDEADKMLESEPMQLFVAPPIALPGGTAVDAASFGGSAASDGMFALGDLNSVITWVVLIIVVASISLYGFNHFKKKGHNEMINKAIGKQREAESSGLKWEHKEP